MGFQTMEITLQSGRDLNKLNPAKMDVYAIVSISGGGDKQEMRTPVDRDGDANPTWNFPMKFKVDDLALQRTLRLTLDFKLVRELPSGDDQDVGEVSVWIKELLHSQVMAASDGTKFFTYPVGTRGQLHFSCKFSDECESALMEKIYYGVEIGSAAASSAVEMGSAAASSAVKAGTAAVKVGGAAALSAVKVGKAVGWGVKKKWDEYNGKNKKQDYFAVKAMDIHKKKMEEAAARKKKDEEEEAARKRADLGKNSTQNQTGSLYTKFTSELYSTATTGLNTLMIRTGFVPGQTAGMSQAGSSQASSRQS